MEFQNVMLDRRSIRQYSDRPVTEEQIAAIIDAARYAPSWKNSQTARYYVILDQELKDRIAIEGTMQFSKNINNIRNAPALVVLATETGISGYDPDGTATTALGSHWQSFDAGIACQSFCLAAYNAGLGTLIMGIFDPEKIAEMLSLPKSQQVSALIAVGYPETHPNAPIRKPLADVMTIL